MASSEAKAHATIALARLRDAHAMTENSFTEAARALPREHPVLELIRSARYELARAQLLLETTMKRIP